MSPVGPVTTTFSPCPFPLKMLNLSFVGCARGLLEYPQCLRLEQHEQDLIDVGGDCVRRRRECDVGRGLEWITVDTRRDRRERDRLGT